MMCYSLACLTFLTALSVSPARAAPPEKRLALVIGFGMSPKPLRRVGSKKPPEGLFLDLMELMPK